MNPRFENSRVAAGDGTAEERYADLGLRNARRDAKIRNRNDSRSVSWECARTLRAAQHGPPRAVRARVVNETIRAYFSFFFRSLFQKFFVVGFLCERITVADGARCVVGVVRGQTRRGVRHLASVRVLLSVPRGQRVRRAHLLQRRRVLAGSGSRAPGRVRLRPSDVGVAARPPRVRARRHLRRRLQASGAPRGGHHVRDRVGTARGASRHSRGRGCVHARAREEVVPIRVGRALRHVLFPGVLVQLLLRRAHVLQLPRGGADRRGPGALAVGTPGDAQGRPGVGPKRDEALFPSFAANDSAP